jgi:hypothetical protein
VTPTHQSLGGDEHTRRRDDDTGWTDGADHGCGARIGAACARRLAREGARLVLADLDSAGVDSDYITGQAINVDGSLVTGN